MNFIEHLRSLAARSPKRIVLPESEDERVVQAAATLNRLGLVHVTLIGTPDRVRSTANAAGIAVPDVPIVDHTTDPRLESYVARFVEIRARKGLTPDDAQEMLRIPVYFAAMMVEQGDADGLVSGCISPTADVVRACILIIRPAEGIATVSSCSVMVLPDSSVGENGVLVFADTGVVPNPTAEQLADIAVSAARTFRAFFDTEPRVAMISFSTKGSASHPLIEKVQRATRLAQSRAPDLAIDGELQIDAALIPEVARRKVKESSVAGRANILIFPSLDVGNVAYKLTERLGKARALGPVLQGLRKPASDLSRGCSADDIVDISCIIAAEAAHWK